MRGGFCPSCGAAAAADARFCAACGSPLARPPANVEPSRQAGSAAPAPAETTVYELKPLVVRTMFEAFACVVTLGIGWVCLWIARMGRRYLVTTQRIESRAGVVTVRRQSLDLFRIEDFEVIEPFFLRLRGAGDLRILSMDQDSAELVLEAIPGVQEVHETLRKLTRDERGRNQVRVVEGS